MCNNTIALMCKWRQYYKSIVCYLIFLPYSGSYTIGSPNACVRCPSIRMPRYLPYTVLRRLLLFTCPRTPQYVCLRLSNVTHSPTHTLTHSLTHSLGSHGPSGRAALAAIAPSPGTAPPEHCPPHSLTPSLNHCLNPPLHHSLTHSLTPTRVPQVLQGGERVGAGLLLAHECGPARPRLQAVARQDPCLRGTAHGE